MSSPGGSGNGGSSGHGGPNGNWVSSGNGVSGGNGVSHGSGGSGWNGAAGGWGSNQYGQQQYYDPITGQPVAGNTPAGYSGAAQGQPGQGQPGQGHPGMQYQGFGAFSQGQQPHPGMTGAYPPPEPPRKGRGPLIGAIAASVVVVIAIATTIVVISMGGESELPAAQETGPPSSPATPTSAPESPAPEPHVAAPQTPVVPGWQVVAVPKRTAIYDAPPDWTLEKPDNIVGFGPPEDAVTLTGAAVYKDGFCPGKSGSFRALSGATARKGGDDTTVATETAQKIADVAYTINGQKPQIALGPPQQLGLHNGAMSATRVNAIVTLPAPGPCDSPSVLVSAIATSNDGDGSVVHITLADQGVPDAVPADVVNRIGESFRPEG